MIALPEPLLVFLLFCFLAASMVQLGAIGYAIALWRASKKAQVEAVKDWPGVSVVLCARNEANNLLQNLPALLSQDYPGKWELIVVDDASDDDTAKVLASMAAKAPARMRVTRVEQKRLPGKKGALALGLQTAVYSCIVVTDADCAPAGAHWLSSMSRALDTGLRTEIVLGYGPLRKAGWPVLSNWPRMEAAWTAALYGSFTLGGVPYMGVGRNMAFKKWVFDRVGGFAAHEHLASGDDDLLVNAAAHRNNTLIQLAPESFVYSDAPPDFRSWLQQKRRHLSAGIHYSFFTQVLLAMIGGSQAFFYGMLVGLSLGGRFLALIWGIYAIRMLLLMIAWKRVLARLRERDLWIQMPFWDFMIACYYGTIAPWFLLSKKKNAWKGL